MWMNIYAFVVVVIVPSIICLIINLSIFIYVRSISRRVHHQAPPMPTNENNAINQQQLMALSRRDIHLLKHMIYIFSIFIFGWSPVYGSVIVYQIQPISPYVVTGFTIVAVISSLIFIVHLFLYDPEIREILRTKGRNFLMVIGLLNF